jgi:hypothetical protein
LRSGLCELYSWYRETEPMLANVLRDVEIVPAMRPVVEQGLGEYLSVVRRILGDPIRVGSRGRRRARIDSTLHAITDFHLWRSLAPLGDVDAADLAAGLVELAANVRPAPAGRTAAAVPAQPETPAPIVQVTPVPPIPQ